MTYEQVKVKVAIAINYTAIYTVSVLAFHVKSVYKLEEFPDKYRIVIDSCTLFMGYSRLWHFENIQDDLIFQARFELAFGTRWLTRYHSVNTNLKAECPTNW